MHLKQVLQKLAQITDEMQILSVMYRHRFTSWTDNKIVKKPLHLVHF